MYLEALMKSATARFSRGLDIGKNFMACSNILHFKALKVQMLLSFRNIIVSINNSQFDRSETQGCAVIRDAKGQLVAATLHHAIPSKLHFLTFSFYCAYRILCT